MGGFRMRVFMHCVLVVAISCFASTSMGFAFNPPHSTNLDDFTRYGEIYGSPNSPYNKMHSHSDSAALAPSSASPLEPSLRRLRRSSSALINVDRFIRKSDKGDHTKGFLRAWKKACATKNAVLVVPKGKTYIVKQLTFSGPCVSYLTMQIRGTIQASAKMSDYRQDRRHWIIFENINGLTVTGGGTFDGKGPIWWKNSCKTNPHLPCKHAPTAVTFYGCKNLMVNEMTVKNAQQMHLTVEDSVNVRLLRVKISSPGDSPNTDGIHVTASKNVFIRNSHISTGDDCISIVSGSTNVQATDITCGPGHGISIGSLGKNKEKAQVSDIHVNRATLTGTSNGVRIKTWQGGSGYATDISFQNVMMHNVSNPIIIDQNYCDQNKPCSKSESAVQLRRVTYRNIQGTSKNEEAIKLDCSEKSCRGITLMNVNLVKLGTEHKAKADCSNVKPRKVGNVFPYCS